MKFEPKDLNDKIFIGVVENVFDETRTGKIQVRVQNIFNKIPLEHIPWAEPFRSLNGKAFSVPAVGKIVNVIFHNGNIYEPQYIFSEKYNTNLQQKMNQMADDEYSNFVALLYDHRTQIYSDDNGVCIDYSNNRIMVSKGSIDIHLKDNDQILNLGHDNADQSAVLGDHFFEWFDDFMTTLSNPSTLMGNLSAPILRPLLDLEIEKYNILRSTFVSDHVKVVDNSFNLIGDYDNNRLSSPAQDDITLLNDEHILESKLVDDKAKKAVLERREKDVSEQIDNEPNPDDAVMTDEEDIILKEDELTLWEESDNEINDGTTDQSIEDALKTEADIKQKSQDDSC